MDPKTAALPELDALRRFTPLDHLSPESLHDVQVNATVRQIAAGNAIFRAGDRDDWSLFLLDGRVELTFEDEARESIASSSGCSRLPLAPQTPRPATARATTDCSLIRVPRSLLEVHLQSADGIDVDVEDSVELEQLQHRLLEKLFDDYVNQRVEVPVLPDIALRVREALRDDNVTPQRMADIVSADPSLAGRLVQVANSAAYRGAVEIGGCRDAISRLGLKASHDIVTAMVMSNVFRTRSKLLARRMGQLWRNSARIAAMSCILAGHSRKVSPDRAMLAGLLHDIGAIAVVAGAEAHPELSHRDGALEAAIDALRGQFGSMILRAWEFADDIVAAAIENDDWERDSAQPDCCDVVQVAVVVSSIGTPRFARVPKLTRLPALARLELEVTPESTLAIIDEADSTIAALEQTLAP